MIMKNYKKTLVLILILFFSVSMLSNLNVHPVQAQLNGITLTQNVCLIQDNSYMTGISPFANIPALVATLYNAKISDVFVSIGEYGWTDIANGGVPNTISLAESNSTYQTFVADCHADGIKVLAWMENDGYMDMYPANYANMTEVYNSVLSGTGMDGIFSDIEQNYNYTEVMNTNLTDNPMYYPVFGGYQSDYFNYNTYMYTAMNAEGKLWDVNSGYYDGAYGDGNASVKEDTPYLKGNLMLIDFYSDVPEFDDPGQSDYWQEMLGVSTSYPWQANPFTSLSFMPCATGVVPTNIPDPVSVGFFVSISRFNTGTYTWNTNTTYADFLNQMTVFDSDVQNYSPPSGKVVGVGVWSYEGVTNVGGWAAFTNLIGQYSVITTTTPTPSPTSTPTPTPAPSTSISIGENEIILFAAFFGFLGAAFYMNEPFLFMISGGVSILCGIDLALLYAGTPEVWSLQFIGLIFIFLGIYICFYGYEAQMKVKKEKRRKQKNEE